MKRILTALCAFLLVSGIAIAEPREPGQALNVRTFTFKHKDADKAAAAIKTLLSADGTMSIQPSTNALVVTDHPDRLAAIAKTLAAFDQAAQPFKLSVRIVAAGRAAGAQQIPANLQDIKDWLSVLPYQAFEKLGDAEVQAKEGEPGVVDMTGGGYRADFKFGDYDPASDSIHITDLQISKVQKDQVTSLLKTSLNLRLDQKYLVSAARAPESKRALMIVLTARR